MNGPEMSHIIMHGDYSTCLGFVSVWLLVLQLKGLKGVKSIFATHMCP